MPVSTRAGRRTTANQEALDVLKGGAVLFGSTTQVMVNEWESFPCGMAYAIKPGYQIVANLHYLNASSVPLDPKPKYQWYTIDPKALTQQVYPFAWELTTFSIPPETSATVTGSCALASDMHVVNVLPRMHRLGIGLDLSYLGGPLDGEKFLTSPGYNPDSRLQVQYTPAVHLGRGRASPWRARGTIRLTRPSWRARARTRCASSSATAGPNPRPTRPSSRPGAPATASPRSPPTANEVTVASLTRRMPALPARRSS
jgi:hypothetical protein